MTDSDLRPIVLITGATGNLGRSLGEALGRDYRIVGLDLKAEGADFPVFEADFTSDAAVELALRKFRDAFGSRIASVIHLVAYFDFTGEDNPLYQSVNVEGTRRLLRALQDFEVEQFVYASTMLVHAPCRPGERIDEHQPIDPRWAYPKSKAAAEAVIRAEHKRIPYVILRLAGVYDEHSMVPTMAQQMARIYERDFQSYFYSGSTLVGQAMLHRDDMLEAFRRAVDRRDVLPPETEILIGEPDAIGYDALQDELGDLIHGVDDWPTLRLPKPIAAAGAWAQGKLEPVIPDAIDGGEAPFIKPFMVAMADDHYALDIRRARDLLGWEPRHRLKDELPRLVAALKNDPAGWYEANGVTPPAWISKADDLGKNPEKLRARHEAQVRTEHGANRWAHFVNMGLATWLITQPLLINIEEPLLRWSEIVLGATLIVFAALALSWRAQWARWLCAGIGALVMGVPFLFSTENAAAYLSDTLVGALIFGFAVCTKPEPGPSAIAALTGPAVPPGWSYNPSELDAALAHHRAGGRRPLRLALPRRLPAWPHTRCMGSFLRRLARSIRRTAPRRSSPLGFESVAGFRCRGRRLHLSAGDPHRHRRLADALAHHALAGGAVRPDDRAARHHLDLLHHHPADRHRHLEHHCADRRGGGTYTNPLFTRRTARDAAVPAPSREGRPELAARALRRRHRRDAGDARCRAHHRRVRPVARRRDQEYDRRRRQPAVEPGSGSTHRLVAAVHAHYARRRWQLGECPPRDRLACSDRSLDRRG